MPGQANANPPAPAAIRPLFDGPLDIIGDVHGEFEALAALLGALGYDGAGRHPRHRRLVFVGDLCDRGPDSPRVGELVMALVAAGRAQCVLGNHELNVMRSAEKAGNGWFFEDDHDRRKGHFVDVARASLAQRQSFREFFATLPLALARDDLRVVHAAWHPPSLAALAGPLAAQGVVDVYREYQERSEREAEVVGLRALLREEYKTWGRRLEDQAMTVPLLPGIARYDTLFQMGNPVRVVTSGVEQPAADSFFASGRWRMVDRVAWWDEYHDEVPVVFGHYWRWAAPSGKQYSRGERDLFDSLPPNAWVGARGNAFCVDFSVGVRYRERAQGTREGFLGRLAGLRWPERELVFDDGERLPLLPARLQDRFQ